MRTRDVFVALSVVIFSTREIVGQQMPARSEVEAQAIARLAQLGQRLDLGCGEWFDGDGFVRGLPPLIPLMREQVDMLVASIPPSANSADAQASVRRVLAQHVVTEAGWFDAPLARIADLRAGRSMLVVYGLDIQGRNPVAVVQGYAEGPGHTFEVTADLKDFEGSTMTLRELPAPTRGELWYIGWGKTIAANGSRLNARVFSFDGSEFRVLWAIESNVHGAIEITKAGFSVTHVGLDRDGFVHDDYVLTLQGPLKVASRITN